ncbi:hypothetical protein ACOSQ4_029198 [Xanthoceras sorbifolium]
MRLAYVLLVLDNQLVLHFVVVAWMTWYQRNQWVHGGKASVSGVDVWEQVGVFLADFAKVCAHTFAAPSSLGKARFWVPLPLSIFKLNVDAAVDKVGGRTEIGLVVRDFAVLLLWLLLAT